MPYDHRSETPMQTIIKNAIGYDPVPLSIRDHPEITSEYRTITDRDGLIDRISTALEEAGYGPTAELREKVRIIEHGPVVEATRHLNEDETAIWLQAYNQGRKDEAGSGALKWAREQDAKP